MRTRRAAQKRTPHLRKQQKVIRKEDNPPGSAQLVWDAEMLPAADAGSCGD
ncbi:hypothetical protein GCM10010245_73070 [Streptomyces spectabilis]|nr:hypothetical protein GCM10010245_73070 [Streptomyces spectabilis]